jgi:hypothetical protein
MALSTGAGIDILVVKTTISTSHLLVLPDRLDETRHDDILCNQTFAMISLLIFHDVLLYPDQ